MQALPNIAQRSSISRGEKQTEFYRQPGFPSHRDMDFHRFFPISFFRLVSFTGSFPDLDEYCLNRFEFEPAAEQFFCSRKETRSSRFESTRSHWTQKRVKNWNSDGDVFPVHLSAADFAFFLGIGVVSLFLYVSSRREKMVVTASGFVWNDCSSTVCFWKCFQCANAVVKSFGSVEVALAILSTHISQ